jgi:hypothetical protein
MSKPLTERIPRVNRLAIKLDNEGVFAVRRMFSSRVDRGGLRGAGDAYALLTGAIEAGYVLVDEIPFVAHLEEYGNEPEPGSDLYDFWFDARRGGETAGHRLLKVEAAIILREMGERAISFEHRCSIGIADVFGSDTRTIVECGNTPPEKVFASLAKRDFPAFLLVPFPNGRYAGERVFGDIYWCFTMSEAGFDWREQRLKEMGAIINRRAPNPALEW